MKKIISLIFLVFIMFTTSCTSGNGITPSPTEFSTQVTKPSSAPTINQLTATATGFTLATAQEPQNSCNLSGGMLPVKTRGKIIFQDLDKGLYLYDMQDGQKHIIPNTMDAFVPFVASSPDHSRLAFFDAHSESGGIISPDGTTTELKIKDKIDGVFYGWLDNKKIIFVERSHSDGSSIVLDVNTGNINEVVTGLHDLFSIDPNRWYAGGYQPSVIFDSTLSRLIYLSGELPGESVGKWGFIMRDHDTQKILWTRLSSDLGTKPKSSPNNEYAAVVITNEGIGSEKIYIINRNGQEIKAIDTAYVGVTLIEWSPDGKKMSYVFFNDKEMLVVYDLASDQIQQYTLPRETAQIVWSPDSKQIATAGSLVDLSTNCVFTLNADNQSQPNPLAWLVESP